MDGIALGHKLHVLMVEDGLEAVDAVRAGFAESRVCVTHASTLAEGKRRLAQPHRFDAIVLDLNLPDGNGADIAEACRASDSDIPIVMVTAKDSVGDRIAGLNRGADD